MKTFLTHPLRASVRSLVIAGSLVLASASFAGPPGGAPTPPRGPGKPLRPICNAPNCTELKYPANSKLLPYFVRCQIGKPCHPHCRRACS